jgi:hypothetical protein
MHLHTFHHGRGLRGQRSSPTLWRARAGRRCVRIAWSERATLRTPGVYNHYTPTVGAFGRCCQIVTQFPQKYTSWSSLWLRRPAVGTIWPVDFVPACGCRRCHLPAVVRLPSVHHPWASVLTLACASLGTLPKGDVSQWRPQLVLQHSSACWQKCVASGGRRYVVVAVF